MAKVDWDALITRIGEGETTTDDADEVRDLLDSVDKLQSEIADLEDDNESWSNKLDSANDTIAELREELQEWREKLE